MTTKREDRSGTVRCLYLAHIEGMGPSVPKVLSTLGREGDLDRDAVKRQVGAAPA